MLHKPVSQYNPINSACRGLPCCTCSATYISQLSPLKSARDQCREKTLQSLWKPPQLAFIYTSQASHIVGCVLLEEYYAYQVVNRFIQTTANESQLKQGERRQIRFSKYLKPD